jgi:dGTPase
MATKPGRTKVKGSVEVAAPKIYAKLLAKIRRRTSSVAGRSLDEEADADRGRVLFSAPFRRLQNKAQVFSLEPNAAVRTRLTHSLEVSSIGGYVAQQAIAAFNQQERDDLGLTGRERPFITFVETACLLHDLGNPPFGHFGEITICDWFQKNAGELKPDVAGSAERLWDKNYADFTNFDGNPQGFRIATRLQAAQSNDLYGLNLTATTLAATLKYPWSSEKIHERQRKKAGYFQSELEVIDWIRQGLELEESCRHPLAFLMEAADDIAYCVSDIEDGIEKGLISAQNFARQIKDSIATSARSIKTLHQAKADLDKILEALTLLENPLFKDGTKDIQRFIPMQDFRAAIIRLLTREAGSVFRDTHEEVLKGTARPLLADCAILSTLKTFAGTSLYSSAIVRNREITAHAVISGLLDAYKPVMKCDRDRFDLFLSDKTRDSSNRPITRESSLLSWVSRKYLSVYQETVGRFDMDPKNDSVTKKVLERIYRVRLIIDHIGGMTDEFALQCFQLINGVYVHNYRN